MNLLKLIQPFLVHFLFQAGRVIFSSVVSIWWFLNGTYIRDRERALPDNYEVSAHILDIWLKYKIDTIGLPTTMKCFWLTHQHFTHPNAVLRDNVTLWNITDEEAIFVQTEKSVNVALMETNGFVSIAQYRHAKRIITLPLTSFNRLAGSVGDPKGELIFVSNTARCGSTLMNQFFEETRHCLCYGEPEVFNYLSVACVQENHQEKGLQDMLVSCIRLLCKPHADKDYAAYVFKIRSTNGYGWIPLIKCTYPKSHCLFMYRDVLPVVQSLTKATQNLPLWQLMIMTANFSRSICKYIIRWNMNPATEETWWKPATPLVKNAWLWVWTCFKYLELREQGVAISGVRYEDLLDKPNLTARAILQYVGLPEEWAEDGLRALKNDSQRNSPLSREKMSRYSSVQMTAAEKRAVEDLAAEYGVPMKWHNCILEGTLTH